MSAQPTPALLPPDLLAAAGDRPSISVAVLEARPPPDLHSPRAGERGGSWTERVSPSGGGGGGGGGGDAPPGGSPLALETPARAGAALARAEASPILASPRAALAFGSADAAAAPRLPPLAFPLAALGAHTGQDSQLAAPADAPGGDGPLPPRAFGEQAAEGPPRKARPGAAAPAAPRPGRTARGPTSGAPRLPRARRPRQTRARRAILSS